MSWFWLCKEIKDRIWWYFMVWISTFEMIVVRLNIDYYSGYDYGEGKSNAKTESSVFWKLIYVMVCCIVTTNLMNQQSYVEVRNIYNSKVNCSLKIINNIWILLWCENCDFLYFRGNWHESYQSKKQNHACYIIRNYKA